MAQLGEGDRGSWLLGDPALQRGTQRSRWAAANSLDQSHKCSPYSCDWIPREEVRIVWEAGLQSAVDLVQYDVQHVDIVAFIIGNEVTEDLSQLRLADVVVIGST